MRTRLLVPTLCLPALLAPSASAFNATPHGANGNDGFYTILGLQNITGSDPAVAQAFSATNAQGVNHLKEDLWLWRVRNADQREFVLGQGAHNERTETTSVAGGFVGNLQGTLDTGGIDFTASSTRGYTFNAHSRYTITKGTFGPSVERTITIQNAGQTTLFINIYSLVDLNVGAVPANLYTGPNGGGSTFFPFIVVEGNVAIQYATPAQRAPGDGSEPVPTFQGGDAATLRALLTDGSTTDLDNTVTGSPGDFAGAFQWDLEIAPGASQTLTTQLTFVPEPGAVALLLLAGLVNRGRRRP